MGPDLANFHCPSRKLQSLIGLVAARYARPKPHEIARPVAAGVVGAPHWIICFPQRKGWIKILRPRRWKAFVVKVHGHFDLEPFGDDATADGPVNALQSLFVVKQLDELRPPDLDTGFIALR